MKAKAKHSALPWAMGRIPGKKLCYIGSHDFLNVAENVKEADAVFIVNAVNTNAALLAALETITKAACALKECLGVQGDELEAGGVAYAPELNAVADAEDVARSTIQACREGR